MTGPREPMPPYVAPEWLERMLEAAGIWRPAPKAEANRQAILARLAALRAVR